ncbi:MAG: hypothetical protein HQL74_13120 [Magnetococcales bacterium]|nr:hypothetical protein [Magnetococcales bacterium]
MVLGEAGRGQAVLGDALRGKARQGFNKLIVWHGGARRGKAELGVDWSGKARISLKTFMGHGAALHCLALLCKAQYGKDFYQI